MQVGLNGINNNNNNKKEILNNERKPTQKCRDFMIDKILIEVELICFGTKTMVNNELKCVSKDQS